VLLKLKVAIALNRLALSLIRVAWTHPVLRFSNQGCSVILNLKPGCTYEMLETKVSHLMVALKVTHLELDRLSPSKVSLTFGTFERDSFPAYPVQLANATAPFTGSIPIGVDVYGSPVLLSLFDQAGGSVSLISGNPGQGKSSALRLVVAGLLHSSTVILWLDPKGGADARFFRNRVIAVGDAVSAPVVIKHLMQINELIDRRVKLLSEEYSLAPLPPVLVLVDEWAHLGLDGTRPETSEVEVLLRRIASMGRAAKVSLVLATQRPTSTQIDVSTRGLASNLLSFYVGDEYASIAALGQKGAETLHPIRDRGIAFFRDGAKLQKVYLYQVPEDLREASETVTGIASLEDLRLWESLIGLPGFDALPQSSS
jgi:hypothetical protein